MLKYIQGFEKDGECYFSNNIWNLRSDYDLEYNLFLKVYKYYTGKDYPKCDILDSSFTRFTTKKPPHLLFEEIREGLDKLNKYTKDKRITNGTKNLIYDIQYYINAGCLILDYQ